MRPCLAAAVSRERAQGELLARPDGFGAAFLPQVPGLARVCSTRARPPVAIFGPRGLCVYGRIGGPLSVWVSNYVCVAT